MLQKLEAYLNPQCQISRSSILFRTLFNFCSLFTFTLTINPLEGIETLMGVVENESCWFYSNNKHLAFNAYIVPLLIYYLYVPTPLKTLVKKIVYLLIILYSHLDL